MGYMLAARCPWRPHQWRNKAAQREWIGSSGRPNSKESQDLLNCLGGPTVTPTPRRGPNCPLRPARWEMVRAPGRCTWLGYQPASEFRTNTRQL
ncbi:hypothetical protein GQ55_9G431800 [Panicum hallii var. hallii]|uniref:Uncharacterized protein n=2 Tax=Panicum hallii TaxID=206008 RepID=A0A2T7CB31_9POAL|nr:hypothetical protein PAHAL_9G418600 [Panicum hallii]PUZ40539.1 hypothetical protein GQ55_9G431800 [Panicum hallii var. hallii]